MSDRKGLGISNMFIFKEATNYMNYHSNYQMQAQLPFDCISKKYS